MKQHIFGFPHNAQNFLHYPTLLVIVHALNVGTSENKTSFAIADFICFCK